MTWNTVKFSPWQWKNVAEAIHIMKDQEVESKTSELRPGLEWFVSSDGLLPTAPHFLEGIHSIQIAPPAGEKTVERRDCEDHLRFKL